jgi:DNA repair protein RecN (Recombination protein N)
VLTGLRLENIALIERLELAFSTGFTVLTGETGAGKSILLDALDALLGGAQGSQGARLLRRGAERGRIEASFSLSPPLGDWLERQELEAEEGDLLLSRDWRLQDGRLTSRHRLNGVVVSRGQVLELRPLLLDLTVQGQTQQLGRPGQQRRWLDRFAGEELAAALEATRFAWRRWKEDAEALGGGGVPTGSASPLNGSARRNCWPSWRPPRSRIPPSASGSRASRTDWPMRCGCRRV